MRTLSLPETDEEGLYDEIQKHRVQATAATLTKAKPTILKAYARYQPGKVCGLSPSIADTEIADTIESNYSILRSGALAADGAEILARSSICCLCGLRATSELDHYLPKDIFPEFAIYTRNLVPVCGVCNKRKSKAYKTVSGDPAFIHAYFDSLSISDPFLKVTLELDDAIVPSFEIWNSPILSNDNYQILRSQFTHFDLGTVYSEEAVEMLVEKRWAIEEYFTEGGSVSVQKYLLREAESTKRHFGINHWKSAALISAANSAEFCKGKFRLLFYPRIGSVAKQQGVTWDGELDSHNGVEDLIDDHLWDETLARQYEHIFDHTLHFGPLGSSSNSPVLAASSPELSDVKQLEDEVRKFCNTFGLMYRVNNKHDRTYDDRKTIPVLFWRADLHDLRD